MLHGEMLQSKITLILAPSSLALAWLCVPWCVDSGLLATECVGLGQSYQPSPAQPSPAQPSPAQPSRGHRGRGLSWLVAGTTPPLDTSLPTCQPSRPARSPASSPVLSSLAILPQQVSWTRHSYRG